MEARIVDRKVLEEELEILQRLLYQHKSQHQCTQYYQRIRGARRHLAKALSEKSGVQDIVKAQQLLHLAAGELFGIFQKGHFATFTLTYLALLSQLLRCISVSSQPSTPFQESGEVVSRDSLQALIANRKNLKSHQSVPLTTKQQEKGQAKSHLQPQVKQQENGQVKQQEKGQLKQQEKGQVKQQEKGQGKQQEKAEESGIEEQRKKGKKNKEKKKRPREDAGNELDDIFAAVETSKKPKKQLRETQKEKGKKKRKKTTQEPDDIDSIFAGLS